MSTAASPQALRTETLSAPSPAERERQVTRALRAALRHPRHQGFDLRHMACVEVLISEAGFASLSGLSPDIARKALAQCEAVLHDTTRPAVADFLHDLHRRAQGQAMTGGLGAPAAAPAAGRRSALSPSDLAALERLLAEGDAQGQQAGAVRLDPAHDHIDFARSDFMPGRKFEVSEIDGEEFHALLSSAPAARSGAERRPAAQGRLVAA